MKKSIYKITNLINGKIYIGQTKNVKERFATHKAKGYRQEENKLLYKAFDKYGLENFSFEVIEENIENYNEREKYWINYYHSYIKDSEYGDSKGYNMTPGGDEPPVNKGENSPFLKHDVKDQLKVKELLMNSNLLYKEIAEITGYNKSSIQRINCGILWYDEKLDYPLRKNISEKETQERALAIIFDLLHTSLTQKAIAEKHGVSRSTVTSINLGKNNKQENFIYPVRATTKKSAVIKGKPILMIDINTDKIIREFPNCTEAMLFLGKTQKESISACARGIQKTAFGYKWKYKE